MAILLDGKQTSAKIKTQVAEEVKRFTADGKRAPVLAVILVGEDPASQVYVRNKMKACEVTGIESKQILLPAETTEEKLKETVISLNNDETVDGILIQLPLPKHIDERAVIETVLPEKDVDAFHPINTGRFFSGLDSFLPCTPAGIISLLEEYNVDIAGKNCVIIGRSNIVGKPMAMMLLKKNGTVTICHSKTDNLKSFTEKADIIVCATGKAGLLDGSMIKDGAVIVDVGMNRDANGKLVGDCDFESCEARASFITPVPGGVGPMTIATLMQNTLKAYKNRNKLS